MDAVTRDEPAAVLHGNVAGLIERLAALAPPVALWNDVAQDGEYQRILERAGET